MNPQQNQKSWRPFAEKLTFLAQYEGQDTFFDRAFEFLNALVTIDSCSVFKVSADKSSGAVHLGTFGLLGLEVSERLAEEYVENGFKNDPMVQTALLSSKVRVRHIPGSHYSKAYRSQFFEKAKLVDKVSSIHASNDALFLVNFYRAKKNGIFSSQDFQDLERLAPIIGGFVLRHTRLTQDNLNVANHFELRLTELLEDRTRAFSRLSPREKEVCKHSLLGREEKDIAKLMRVTLNTVITHRRRSYSKLNIGSKAELFQLALAISG